MVEFQIISQQNDIFFSRHPQNKFNLQKNKFNLMKNDQQKKFEILQLHIYYISITL